MSTNMDEIKSMFERMTVEIDNFNVRQNQLEAQHEKALVELKESIEETRRFDRGKSTEGQDGGGEVYTPSGYPMAWLPPSTGSPPMPSCSPARVHAGVGSIPQYAATMGPVPQPAQV
ncbi:putative protein isoform X2 [Capsicum galapagoense]